MRKAQEELAQQKEVIMAQDKELRGKSSEAEKLREQNNQDQLKIKELEHNISKHRKDSQDAADKVTPSHHPPPAQSWILKHLSVCLLCE